MLPGESQADEDQNLIGVETTFDVQMSRVVDFHILIGKFNFVVAPLMSPDYRPSSSPSFHFGTFEQSEPFVETDMSMEASLWNNHVVGKISTWIDLDSEDKNLVMDSEIVLRREIDLASYLALEACLLPAPKGTSCTNYARCVNQIMHILPKFCTMQLWLRIPLGKTDDESLVDYWKTWNSFRLLCEHHSRLWVALDNLGIQASDNSLARWYGEPVAAFILHTDSFSLNQNGGLDLSMHLQKLVADFYDHLITIVISAEPVHTKATAEDPYETDSAADSQSHSLQPYRISIALLYQQMGSLTEQERPESCIRDVLQMHAPPLKRNLHAMVYLSIEQDTTKYELYKKAICQALLDRVPDEKASEITTVLVVVGAGRGILVKTSVQAAKETGRKLKVYAMEKNRNALGALNGLIRAENIQDIVTIVTNDVQHWNAPEAADILVSELLGSFGDNELSPECLDEAQRFLKEDGISIPSLYTSFLQPVTASKIYKTLKEEVDILQFEKAFIVKIHNEARLAPSLPVFTFTHPKHSDKESNRCHKKLLFVIPGDKESALVHGFTGYFDATLYKDVHIETDPSTAAVKMCTWNAIFFPLRIPICVDSGSILEVHFWRCCDSAKVWYEWCVTSPSISPIYNSKGCGFKLEL